MQSEDDKVPVVEMSGRAYSFVNPCVSAVGSGEAVIESVLPGNNSGTLSKRGGKK